METKTYREFLITPNGFVIELPDESTTGPGEFDIHVIEIKAYTELAAKLAIAVEALKFYETRQHIETETLPNKIENGAVAQTALAKIAGGAE